MTAQPLDAAAFDVIEDYLTQLARVLGPRDRTTQDLVAEVRDGLLTAAERYVAEGWPAVDAARTAVRDCGAVEHVTPVMRADVIATRARGIVLALVRTGPFAAAAWAATLMSSPASPWRSGGGSPWRTTMPWLGVGVLLTLACSLMANTAVSGTGRQVPRLAHVAAIAATVICAVTDVAALALVAVWAVAAPHMLAWPVATAVAVSGARILFVGRSVRRLRHSLA